MKWQPDSAAKLLTIGNDGLLGVDGRWVKMGEPPFYIRLPFFPAVAGPLPIAQISLKSTSCPLQEICARLLTSRRFSFVLT